MLAIALKVKIRSKQKGPAKDASRAAAITSRGTAPRLTNKEKAAKVVAVSAMISVTPASAASEKPVASLTRPSALAPSLRSGNAHIV